MIPKTTQKQFKAFRRLAFADIAFRQAHLLCAHIETLGPPSTIANLWQPLLAGVVVTYRKPFGECDGLGPLPETFSEFPPGSAHKLTHDLMKNARNWIYAHRDLIEGPKLLSETLDQQATTEVILDFTEGHLTIRLTEPCLDDTTIFHIRALCEIQISRVSDAIGEWLSSCANTKSYKSARYVLGRDFP